MKIANHRVVVALSGTSLAFVLGGFFWSLLALDAPGSNQLILHFNDLDGITKVGGLGVIIFVGIFGTLVTAMNFFIAMEFDSRDRFFGKFLAATTLLLGVLLFIAFAAIINVNV